MRARDLYLRDQAHLRKRCGSHLQARGHETRASERRKALVDKLRAERGIHADTPYYGKRSLVSVLATDHNETLVDPDVDLSTSQDAVFGDNTSCLLWPSIEPLAEGPYYVRDELIRQNGIEGLPGINMTLDVQIIDTSTCEPVANQYTEFWQANATGVYSGTDNTDNGDGTDPSILNTTFSRAIWPTDDEGVVQVDLLFPGHYAPRATHTHIIVHQNTTVLANGTLEWGAGTLDYVGQIFYDQDLIDEADTVYPYTENPNVIKPNSEDMVISTLAADVDPVAWYVYLGDSLADGIVAWVTIGIDTSAVYDVEYAATWTADGGVENPDAPQP
ncbi:putative dioxygenase [Cryphonectria parasitica EP155]|uniref:Dioxygenase n=1 Tax=Cryphonectria parasitica (strain ATCC 38755 / EP155) TaxID=660469 RepID=A0A9P4XW22_CRYP1|nr:putative dioxygenase [Cryphonectria parasitica EP155]KAF3762014.1 putative dioxygenase [Cryphonectria parasitica EP155]